MSGRTPDQLLAEFGHELLQSRPPRAKPARLVALGVALSLAAAVAYLLAVALPSPSARDEVAATPSPAGTATWPPTPPQTEPNATARPLSARALDPATLGSDRAVRADLEGSGSGASLQRAWSVPALKGRVHLIGAGASTCLSAPDPATRQPQLERGKTCAQASAFDADGLSLTIGSTLVAVVPDGARDPILRSTHGASQQLHPDAGLVVVTGIAAGTTVRLFDRSGEPRTIAIVPTVDWVCPDGHRGFRFPVDAIPATDPCPTASADSASSR